MDWKQRITSLYQNRVRRSVIASPFFSPPVSSYYILKCTHKVPVTLTTELASLLQDTNGFGETITIDANQEKVSDIIWPIETIVQETVQSSMHKSLLVFAPAGVDGIVFCSPLDANNIMQPDVYAYYPLDKDLTHLAPTLKGFIEGWITGNICV